MRSQEPARRRNPRRRKETQRSRRKRPKCRAAPYCRMSRHRPGKDKGRSDSHQKKGPGKNHAKTADEGDGFDRIDQNFNWRGPFKRAAVFNNHCDCGHDDRPTAEAGEIANRQSETEEEPSLDAHRAQGYRLLSPRAIQGCAMLLLVRCGAVSRPPGRNSPAKGLASPENTRPLGCRVRPVPGEAGGSRTVSGRCRAGGRSRQPVPRRSPGKAEEIHWI